MLNAAERAALENLVATRRAEHAEWAAKRAELREQLRSAEWEMQKRETHIAVLEDILAEDQPKAGSAVVPRIGPRGREEGRPNLTGKPRVHAILTILAEADRELHRDEILQELRHRGFPNERLGDTSAALAYLKRTGRVRNPARGFWRAA